YVVAGLLALAALAGVVSTASVWTVLSAGVFGFACGGGLALALTLPALLSEPRDVPRVSAGTFTISYVLAMTISILSGAVWDWTGVARAAFVPIALSALPLLLLTPTLRFTRQG